MRKILLALVTLVTLLGIACLRGEAIMDFVEEQYGIEMVYVEGGAFMMGCTLEQGNCRNEEKPVHPVKVSDFYIGKYPVTQKQWFEIMGTDVYQQRDKRGPDFSVLSEGDNYPMYYVSWDEAQDFIKKLNEKTSKHYRLPTEAEWEYAARGGNKSRGYTYSGSNEADEVAWYKNNSGGEMHPVGTKKANELGIYDMSGNLLEWTNDWFDSSYYENSPTQNPEGPASGMWRVRRGGSYAFNMGVSRVSFRLPIFELYNDGMLCFRLALSLK